VPGKKSSKKPTITALAVELGISRTMVYKAAARGMPVDSIDAARDWRRRHVELKGQEPGDLTEETRRLRSAQADVVELEAAEKRGELAPVDDFQIALNEIAVMVSSRLEALPGRCANDLVILTDAALIRAYLQKEVRAIRDALAARLEAWARDIVRGKPVPPASESDA
jgi:hypothetical protein